VTGIRRNREFWERAVREVERGATVSAVAQRLAVRPGDAELVALAPAEGVGEHNEAALAALRKSGVPEFLPVVLAQPAPTGGAGLVEIDAEVCQEPCVPPGEPGSFPVPT
jgi:hypothetical protein